MLQLALENIYEIYNSDECKSRYEVLNTRENLIQNSIDLYLLKLSRTEQCKLFFKLYEMKFINGKLSEEEMTVMYDFEELKQYEDKFGIHYSESVWFILNDFDFKGYLQETLEKLCKCNNEFK